MLRAFSQIAWRVRIAFDTHGQDLIEYALLAGLISTAGIAFFPEIHDSVGTIFKKVNRSLTDQISHHHDH